MWRNLGSHQYNIWNVCDFTRFHDASLFHGIDLPILWMRMNGPFRKIFQLVSMQAPWRICDGLLNKVLRSASHLVKVCNSCIHIYKLYTYTYVYMYICIYVYIYTTYISWLRIFHESKWVMIRFHPQKQCPASRPHVLEWRSPTWAEPHDGPEVGPLQHGDAPRFFTDTPKISYIWEVLICIDIMYW